ncbi:MAG: hypothetical protein CVU60_02150 [Deltaproteobacteria bacterium HGW-Deltaproteobacteria-18]|nr:MAG: hypothetical protein CVU60_02150 [Deltaproteobacteria bacterium HGW-Deltaproteobacteria-18]
MRQKPPVAGWLCTGDSEIIYACAQGTAIIGMSYQIRAFEKQASARPSRATLQAAPPRAAPIAPAPRPVLLRPAGLPTVR